MPDPIERALPVAAGLAPQERPPQAPLGVAWTPAASDRLRLLLRRGIWLVVAVALSVVLFRVVARFELGVVWDDAFIFQRYAANLRAGHGWAWQPGGDPTYGTTSLAFVLPVTVLQIACDNVALSALLASTIGGVLFLGAMALTLHSVRASRVVKAMAMVAFFACAAWSALPDHFVSGMDTTWALTFVAGYLWLLQRLDNAPSRRRAFLLGALGGLTFAVRPDLLAFTICIPAAWALLTHDPRMRRWLLLCVTTTALLTGVQLGFNAWYFQSALPLPFYAKSLRLYGDSMHAAYRGVSSENLIQFVSDCWPLVTVLLLDLLAGPRQWWKRLGALDKAALCAALLFGAYYWFVALPVMGMSQRFLQPLLPLFAWAAARTAARWQDLGAGSAAADDGHASPPPAATWGLYLAASMGLMMSLFMLWPQAAKHGSAFVRRIAKGGMHFDIHAHSASAGPRSYWYKLNEVSALPDDVVLATTEVGFLGVLNPGKRIIDMAGLNERAFAHRPFDGDTLLTQHRPDFIYLPHRDYKKMRTALIGSAAFADYEYVGYKRLRTRFFGVAVRRDSPHYAAMHALLPGGYRPAAGALPGRRFKQLKAATTRKP